MTDRSAHVPTHLSTASKRWIEHLLARYHFSPGQFQLLVMAAECWDRHKSAAKIARKEGPVVTSPNGCQMQHPAVKTELQAVQQFSRLLKQLGLDADEQPAPKAPGAR